MSQAFILEKQWPVAPLANFQVQNELIVKRLDQIGVHGVSINTSVTNCNEGQGHGGVKLTWDNPQFHPEAINAALNIALSDMGVDPLSQQCTTTFNTVPTPNLPLSQVSQVASTGMVAQNDSRFTQR